VARRSTSESGRSSPRATLPKTLRLVTPVCGCGIDELAAVPTDLPASGAGETIETSALATDPDVQLKAGSFDKGSQCGQRRLAVSRLVGADHALRRPRPLGKLGLRQSSPLAGLAQETPAHDRRRHPSTIANCRYPVHHQLASSARPDPFGTDAAVRYSGSLCCQPRFRGVACRRSSDALVGL
jgi:hypothetical protein